MRNKKFIYHKIKRFIIKDYYKAIGAFASL